MKKYLLVLSGLELGGAERQAINFARYLQRIERSVVILGLTNHGAVSELCKNEEIECISMPVGSRSVCLVFSIINAINKVFFKKKIWVAGEALIWKLAQFIRKRKIDICISYCTYANTILGCTKNYYSKPIYVWYQRDAGIFDKIGGYQNESIRKMDYVLANSRSGQEWIKEAYNANAIIINNGVKLLEAERGREEWRKELAVEDNVCVCTMIANLSSAKNHMLILKIWKELQNKKLDKEFKLVFAGRFDDQYENLRQYVDDNNLREQVCFLGAIKDISGLLEATDICVFGAISEGSPNGIIEPAFKSLPVVATDLPEIRDVLAIENYQYLFSENDISHAVNSLLLLWSDRKLRNKIGKKNYDKAQELFSEEKNFDKLVKLIES